jgi:hypothetical protein
MIVIKFHTEDDEDTTVMNVSRWVIKLKQYILLSHSSVFLAKYPVRWLKDFINLPCLPLESKKLTS